MDKRIWLPVLAAIVVCIAAIGAAIFRGDEPSAADARPAADAPVDVVRMPASATPAQDPACRTCKLGAGKGWL